MNLKNFDITSYLRTKGISVSTEGKNVSPGWIGIKCLWCDDTSNHLGINLSSKTIKCWKCKVKGPATRIIQKLDYCGSDEAEHIAENFFEHYIPEKKEEWICSIKPEEVLPKVVVEEPLPIHLDYLRKRNFDPSELIRKYQIKFTHHLGRLKFRVIIPIIMDRRVVGFTARDVTDRAELRYISSDRDKYLVNPDSVFYNIDSVYHTAFVVEGATDVWRLGEGACSTLGTEFNDYHIRALLDKNIQRAFVIFDAERQAIKLAEKMGAMLSAAIPYVEVIILKEGDPAKLSPQEALRMKEELLK